MSVEHDKAVEQQREREEERARIVGGVRKTAMLPMDAITRNPDASVDDLHSEFDYQSELERRKRKRDNLLDKDFSSFEKKPDRKEAKAWFQEEHGRMHRQITRMMAMDAYSRHKELINLYYLSYPGATTALQRDTSKDRTDYDVLREHHKFLWGNADDASLAASWEARMAKKYYDKLFKEYCIIDLTYFKKNKVAMRWRTEKEVRSGKGHLICGSKKCSAQEDLTSWEVNFSYSEAGERKNALVKVRLCSQCSEMLNYGSQKRRVERKKKNQKEKLVNSEKLVKNLSDGSRDEAKKPEEEAATSKAVSGLDAWTAPVQETVRTMDDDIDEFLDDLFE